jgi:cytoskeletal protein CcmA (bactofilin family)
MFDLNKKDADRQAAREPAYGSGDSGHGGAAAASGTSAKRGQAVIGPSILIDGELRGGEDLLIEGQVNGTVELKDNAVTIGAQGRVKANIHARAIYVEGSLDGDAFGSERVSIRKSAQMRGNVSAPTVSLEDGARFKGSIEMGTAGEAAQSTRDAVKPAPAATADRPAKPNGPAPAGKTGSVA